MAIYMKIPHVTGNVTSKNHHGWVEITVFYFDVKRQINFTPNTQNNRTTGATRCSSLELLKPRDASSNVIMEAIAQAKSIPKIDIHCCTTGETIEPYEKYELSNVLFHSQKNRDNKHGGPSERVLLHYTNITRTYISRDANNQPQSPKTSGFDLET
jgi:type VI secretion system Hcp family effector